MFKHYQIFKKKSVAVLMGCALLPATALWSMGAQAVTAVYVSAATDGAIDAYTLNTQSGELTAIGKAAAGAKVMPMAISPDKSFLYAATRGIPYSAVSYKIDPKSGVLSPLGKAELPDSMAYISTDRTGKWLFSASYGGNKVTVNGIDKDGKVNASVVTVVPTGEKAHSIIADRKNKFVFASNLGSDQIVQFRFDAKTGTLTPNEPAEITLPKGNGPRHLVLSPDNKTLYVSNELSGKVARLALNENTGQLTLLDYTDTVPADAGMRAGTITPDKNSTDSRPQIWSADLRLTPNGQFLYVSERTKSTITLLRVEPKTGQLQYITRYPTETQPRGIQIDPSGKFLIASGEKSTSLSVYRINQDNGDLVRVGQFPTGKGANWVEIVKLP
ncbi:lactonase family protein [Pectobacterium versatile]|uniref:lactonase family protein n=1 Tax=Pectobacterium versatile TaxID=2488639 RepID=UPI0020BFF14F|nr:lactonase family protein [Pectobacterium versatile]MCO4315048.1 lactonase family protein [Pectobacterium versatile]